MSEKILNPLQEAQQIVSALHQQSDRLSPVVLKAQLEHLNSLLEAAQHERKETGESAASSTTATGDSSSDAQAARAELQDFIDRNATFTSVMVHEIRKPMTVIRGYSDMLAKPELLKPEMTQMFVETIRSNIIRMEGLVSDISDINKLSSGRIKLDSKMAIFSQVVLEVQKLLTPVLNETKKTVIWNIPQGLPMLTTDSKQLAKAVFNLVKNAVQYTPEGTVTVNAERRENNVLYVEVVDTGIGLKPEEIAHLGEPFYRADHELVTMTKGYGLGIPVAMGFLKLMDSQLNVKSVFGEGSTFSFMLTGMG